MRFKFLSDNQLAGCNVTNTVAIAASECKYYQEKSQSVVALRQPRGLIISELFGWQWLAYIKTLLILLVIGSVLAFSGCKCLTEPSEDSTAPTAGLILEWRATNGETRSRTFTEDDADITITASTSRRIVVLYSGGDSEGLKSIELDYDMTRNTGTGIIRPLLVTKEVVVNCPKKNLGGSETFDPEGLPWRYEFRTISRNWLGLETRSAKVTIQTE